MNPGTADKELVLFDLDGVIIDSRSNMEIAWRAVTRELDLDVTFERYFNEIGRPFPDILERLGVGEFASEAERIFRTESMKNIIMVQFFNGISDMLTFLQKNGINLGVVTSKDTMRTNAILAMLPMDFITVQTPNDRFRGKPAPDHLLVAMAEAHADPINTVYVGDMDSDFEAAVRAGINYVHADWGYGALLPDQAPIIGQPSELLSYLRLVQS